MTIFYVYNYVNLKYLDFNNRGINYTKKLFINANQVIMISN